MHKFPCTNLRALNVEKKEFRGWNWRRFKDIILHYWFIPLGTSQLPCRFGWNVSQNLLVKPTWRLTIIAHLPSSKSAVWLVQLITIIDFQLQMIGLGLARLDAMWASNLHWELFHGSLVFCYKVSMDLLSVLGLLPLSNSKKERGPPNMSKLWPLCRVKDKTTNSTRV